MKNLQIILFSFLIFSCSTSSTTNQNITGKIENNSDYFGGANPPQFIIDELQVYKPTSNELFYVRNALNYAPYTPTITSFITNATGNYVLNLPAGNYAITSEEKYEYEQNPIVPTDCDFLKTPDFFLTISPNQQNYSNQYTRKLNYCLPLPN
jgi:hypothetical protein